METNVLGTGVLIIFLALMLIGYILDARLTRIAKALESLREGEAK